MKSPDNFLFPEIAVLLFNHFVLYTFPKWLIITFAVADAQWAKNGFYGYLKIITYLNFIREETEFVIQTKRKNKFPTI